MKFSEALEEMKNNNRVKLLGWGNIYCDYDKNENIILVHFEDGKIGNLMSLTPLEETIKNIESPNWIKCLDEEAIDGTSLDFKTAMSQLRKGLSIRRKAWEKGNYVIPVIENNKSGKGKHISQMILITSFGIGAYRWIPHINCMRSSDWEVCK